LLKGHCEWATGLNRMVEAVHAWGPLRLKIARRLLPRASQDANMVYQAV
jgi:hypothetical protein